MTKQHEIEAAYYQGLREMNGMDPEQAADLGFATSTEDFERHIAAGKEMAETAQRARILSADSAHEHAAVEEIEGRVVCANCNRPGCPGCGRS